MTSPILPAFHIVVAPPTTAVITVPFDFDLFDSKCHCRLNYHCIFKIFLTNSINCIKQLCDFIFSRIKLCRIFIHHYSTDKSCPLMPYRPLNSTRLLPTMDDYTATKLPAAPRKGKSQFQIALPLSLSEILVVHAFHERKYRILI